MERYTEYHCGVAVIKNKELLKEAMAKLAAYEDAEEENKHMNDGWIPIEERLPKEPKENQEFEGKKIELYLVTVDGTKYPFRAFWNGKFFTDGWSKCEVIAWRPLPEPYRPEEKYEIYSILERR